MTDMLRVAVSGLRAFQRALDTTSHNIANASTPGYSRQNVNLSTLPPQQLGSLSVGSGVGAASVDRAYDGMLTSQLRTTTSSYSRLSAYADRADALNRLFADSGTGLSATMQKFVNALQGVASTPTSTAARQVLLSEAQNLAQRLQGYDQRLDELESDINSRLAGEAAAITSAADTIARLNEQIVTATASSGQAPNDLLDARDQAIAGLSEHVGVSVVPQDDGAYNVFIGSGQSLVTGSIAAKIVVQKDAFDPTRNTLAYQTSGGTVDLSGVISGGSVGGVLDFRREMLDPARNELGQMAYALTDVVNAQHREGMDLGGNLGGDLFAIGGVPVLAGAGTTGAATVNVTRIDAGAVTTQDYVLGFDGGAWSLRRADTGATVPMTGSGTAADPFVADGLSFVIGGGAPAGGDRYLVRPTAGAIDGMRVLITDPSRIAAASPIRTAVASGNTGTGTISAGEVLDAADPQLLAGVELRFISPTQYVINGDLTSPQTYTPGADIDLNGWRVQLGGAPQAGDRFTVGSNAGGVGDNRNALALSNVLGQGVLSGGTESLAQASSRFIGHIGVAAGQAQAGRDAQQLIHEESLAARDAASGVNLDEEAANLLRYQQAYQAAAQVIRITQELFDSLLAATNR